MERLMKISPTHDENSNHEKSNEIKNKREKNPNWNQKSKINYLNQTKKNCGPFFLQKIVYFGFEVSIRAEKTAAPKSSVERV